MKCCITLSCQVMLSQLYEISAWLHVKINAVYLVTVNRGREDVDKGQVFEILRKLVDLCGVATEGMGVLPMYSSRDKS